MHVTSTRGMEGSVVFTLSKFVAVVRENYECEGKDYHTKHILSCPLHSLAYEIECDRRADMADVLVHPVLKRGHSNWLEASHNVFIRFRPKHINLERLQLRPTWAYCSPT